MNTKNKNEDSETVLRSLRKGRHLSMTELALLANIEPSTLSLIERGKRPSRPTAEKIADAIDVTPEELWADFETFRKY